MTENFDGEKKSLEFKLQSQYSKKEDLEVQVKDLTSLITDLNVTRNYLQLNYEDQEKVETDLLVEKKNISRKQQIKLAE